MSIATASKRRVMLAALLSVAALMAMTPGIASATFSPNPSAYNGHCDSGEFCLAYGFNGKGGMFDSPGSDDKLTEHRFVNPSRGDLRVNDNTYSAWNRGTGGLASRRSVLVYNGYLRYVSIGWDPGLIGCIRPGSTVFRNLPSDVLNKISSYKWVTDAQCREARQL